LLKDFENNIKEIKNAIINGDEAFLKKRFQRATNKRKELG